MDTIKVAVRVRPFNSREKEKNAKCIISMHGKSTTIRNPESGDEKTYTFDYSYWSHDSSAPDFADQKKVFNDLGVSVLENAWNGYNVSLFAYGQTGILSCAGSVQSTSLSYVLPPTHTSLPTPLLSPLPPSSIRSPLAPSRGLIPSTVGSFTISLWP
jgi:hypothetical protein